MNFEIIEIDNSGSYRAITKDAEKRDFWFDKKENKLLLGAYTKDINYIIDYCLKNNIKIKEPKINEEIWRHYGDILIQFEIINEKEVRVTLKSKIIEYKIKNTDEDIVNDAIKFLKILGYYNILYETDLACGPLTEDANNAIIKIEKIAQKYGIYSNKKACDDVWYHDYDLIPTMTEFAKKVLYSNQKNNRK